MYLSIEAIHCVRVKLNRLIKQQRIILVKLNLVCFKIEKIVLFQHSFTSTCTHCLHHSTIQPYKSVIDKLGQNRVLGFFSYINFTNFKRTPYPQLKSFNIYKVVDIYLTNFYIIQIKQNFLII